MTFSAADESCVVCGADLSYSAVALVRGCCDVCVPDSCPECGCVNIKQRKTPHPSAGTEWVCDNGCFFEVPETDR